MIKEGAAVIDVGINRVQDPVTGKHRLVGDVDFEGKPELWMCYVSILQRDRARSFGAFSLGLKVWIRKANKLFLGGNLDVSLLGCKLKPQCQVNYWIIYVCDVLSLQVWGRRLASSLLSLEEWDPWLWPCWWRTPSRQPRMFCCIPQRGSEWPLHPKGQHKMQQQHIPVQRSNFFIFFPWSNLTRSPQQPLHTDWKSDGFMALLLLTFINSP